jgi:hypothetical protein
VRGAEVEVIAGDGCVWGGERREFMAGGRPALACLARGCGRER